MVFWPDKRSYLTPNLCLAFLLSAHLTRAEPPYNCPHWLSRLGGAIVDTRNLGREDDFDSSKLKDELQVSFLSLWKKALLYRLWKKEAQQGYRIINFRGNLYTDDPYYGGQWVLPYILAVPRDLYSGFYAISHAKGMDPYRRYGLLPLKLVISNVIHRFYSHLGIGLSLGGGHVLMQSLGWDFQTPDFFLEEIDTSDLEPDEVIVLVKFQSSEIRASDGNTAGLLMAKEMESAKEKNPQKILILDLSREAGITNPKEFAQKITQFSNEEIKHKKIRKMIIGAHGEPGILSTDSIGTQTHEDMAIYFSPFRPHFTPRSQLFLNSCNQAANLEARLKVQQLGNALLPKGSEILVPTLYGNVGGVYYRGMLGSRGTPVWLKTGLLAMPTLEYVFLPVAVKKDKTERKIDEKRAVESWGAQEGIADWPAVYTYTVGSASERTATSRALQHRKSK